MKKFLFVSLLLVVLPVYASHIVGGEFELIHLSGYDYQLNMVLYFDDINGDPAAFDNLVIASIYRKRDNVFMTNLTLPFISRTSVLYSQPACTVDTVKTDRIFYSARITLSPDSFNDPAGYYVSWQRCCRNYTIENIYSERRGGITAGQTFYLEIPPVVKNGQPFVNSSPHLFPPLSDYGCPGKPYFADFAGTDDDGDSLVYSLTTPLNTFGSSPVASPGPYPLVTWQPGYSLSNIVGGSPDLRISTQGLLTCTPMSPGYFVFAVKVEQFREGLKIGETRRDFQLYVAHDCVPDQPPQITGKKLSDASFSYIDNMYVSFSGTTADGDRCIQVRVSDPDSQDPLHYNLQNVTIKAVALNFRDKNVIGILPLVTTATLRDGSTADFTICFPQCPFIIAPFQIGIVAFDAACPQPLTDTLKITVNQQPPPNTNAYFLPQKKITAQLNEGSTGSWPFVAKDDDGDNLIVSLITDGFVLKDAGMDFKILNQQAGSANGELDWNAFCKNYEFTKKTDFTIKVLVDDQDKCNIIYFDTAVFRLKVLLPKIDPKLKIYNESATQDVTSSTITMNLGHVGFDVIGTDTDVTPIDTLNLSLLEANGDPPLTGYTFENATALHEVESKFTWNPDCSIFKDTTYTNNYTLKFLVANYHCKTPLTDTAFVKLIIKDIKSIDKDFLPANVITTYPDHCNDFFAIEGFESEPDCYGQTRQAPSVPADNCTNRFEQVRIYDRWGKQVFESTDRKFRWYAANESAGVYYYVVYFSRTRYKSSLTIIH